MESIADIPEFSVKVRKIARAQEWNERSERIKYERNSMAIWDNMSKEDREILIDLVDEVLTILKADPNKWLPKCLNDEGGNGLDVSFRILFSMMRDDRAGLTQYRKRLKRDIEETERILKNVEGL